jgi:hypothetical protein
MPTFMIYSTATAAENSSDRKCTRQAKLFLSFPFKYTTDDVWIAKTLFEELYDCSSPSQQ